MPTFQSLLVEVVYTNFQVIFTSAFVSFCNTSYLIWEEHMHQPYCNASTRCFST
jgi:hypothetical protein